MRQHSIGGSLCALDVRRREPSARRVTHRSNGSCYKQCHGDRRSLDRLLCLQTLPRTSLCVWGDWVKASFDYYLPDLAKRLALALPAKNDEQMELWKSVSRRASLHHP